MSVASKNPFALLDAEDNSRSSSPAPAPKKAAAAPQAPAPANRGQQKTRGGPASRGGKYYARGGKPSAPNDASTPAGAEEPGAEGRKPEGGRGGRGPRGRGRGGNAGGRGRQFDRHSATGRTDSQKKVHQGWGGDEGNSELKTEQAAAADAAAEPATGEWGAEATASAEWGNVEGDAAAPADAEDKAESKPRKEREEEEDNTLTLDQYLAQQKEKDTVIPKLEGVRQANEGAGEEIWKGVVPLAKNEEEEAYFVGKQKSAPKPKSKKEEKVYLEFEGRFERPDRGGRGRGRGGDRGDRGERRGGRGAGRGGRGQRQGTNAQTPNVDDQNAFPSLA